MKTIEIIVNEKHAQNPSGCIVCDNSDYQIKFIFDDEWSAHNYKTARFVYNGVAVEKPFTGDTVAVPKIRTPGTLSIGVYTVDLATTPAEIKCCPSIVSKTGKTPDPEGDVYDQVITLLETLDVNKVSEKTAKAYEMLNVVSNAVTGKAYDTVVRVDDVSPIEHTVRCNARSRNLVPYPYAERDLTRYGVTFSIDESDKGIVLNGTAEDHTSFCVATNTSQKLKVVKGEKYTLSCISEFQASTGYAYLQNFVNNKAIEVFSIVKGAITFTPTETGYAYIGIVAVKGATFDNEKVYVQLEKGDTATEYVHYVDPTTATVRRFGKNLWHNEGSAYPRTISGVTVDYDEDTGIYTFNGTSKEICDIYAVTNGTDILHINKGETWTLKSEVVGGTVDGVSNSYMKISPIVNNSTYDNGLSTNSGSMSQTRTFTEPSDITKMYFYIYGAGIVFDNFKLRIQLEQSAEPTGFEKYKPVSMHTPKADGTVDGVKSVSPTMTLYTDKANVLLDVEYNRDLNKVIAKLEAQTT